MNDSVSIVTGGGGLIGSAICRRLAQAGSRVVVSGRHLQTCSETVKQVQAAGGQAVAIACDVGDPEQVECLMDATLQKWGRIDVLVNNAAFTGCYEDLFNITPQRWEDVVRATLTSVFLCSQAAASHMIKQGGGRIINIGSVGAFQPFSRAPHYSAAKAGVEALTKSLALALAKDNILVTVVHPGAISSEGPDNWDPGADDTPVTKIPLGRTGKPEEIAGLVAFLAGDESTYLTGASIVADGGYLLN